MWMTINCSYTVYTQLKQLWKLSLKKISGIERESNSDPAITGAVLRYHQWAIQANWEMVTREFALCP